MKRRLLIIALLSTFLCIPCCGQKHQRGKASFYSKRATGARSASGQRIHHSADCTTMDQKTKQKLKLYTEQFPALFGITVKVERLDNPVPFMPETTKLPKVDFEMAEFEPDHYFEKKEMAREKAEAKVEAKEIGKEKTKEKTKEKEKAKAKEKAPNHRHTP